MISWKVAAPTRFRGDPTLGPPAVKFLTGTSQPNRINGPR